MQGDLESCLSVVYFHMNIPGDDSYSLVWRAKLQRRFPDSRHSVQTPTSTGLGQWRMDFLFEASFWMIVAKKDGLWNEKDTLYTIFKSSSPVKRWDVENKKIIKNEKRRIPYVAVYSSAVRTQRCFFGCHSRLAWDLYLNSWQTWQCSFSAWLPQRPLSKCHGNQIVTRLSPVTPPLTTIKKTSRHWPRKRALI